MRKTMRRKREKTESAGGHHYMGWSRSTWTREVHPEDRLMKQEWPWRDSVSHKGHMAEM